MQQGCDFGFVFQWKDALTLCKNLNKYVMTNMTVHTGKNLRLNKYWEDTHRVNNASCEGQLPDNHLRQFS